MSTVYWCQYQNICEEYFCPKHYSVWMNHTKDIGHVIDVMSLENILESRAIAPEM
jgi:hypothetical protein